MQMWTNLLLYNELNDGFNVEIFILNFIVV